MRHLYAGSKNRLGQRRDSELLAENDGSQQLLVYFLFQKFFISDARQASCQNNVGNLWIVTHGYIESLSGKCTFFFFFYLQFFSFCCDNAVLMFWLYWGTRTSWFGLGKDHIFASCYSGNCPNILLKPYGSRLQIVVAKISSDVATASSFMLPIHAKMFVSNCNTTTRGRSSESNWSPDLQFYSAVFSSRPISSQLLCSKCLSLRLADVNILKLTTSSQNLSAKSFNIPTSCSLDVSLSNYWLHCPQPRGQYRSTALWSQYQKIWTKLTQGMERRLSTSTYAPQTCSIKSQRLVPNIQWFPTCECWSWTVVSSSS